MVLNQFVDQIHLRGKHAIFCGARPKHDAMDQCIRPYGSDWDPHVFKASFGTFASAKLTLRRAHELVSNTGGCAVRPHSGQKPTGGGMSFRRGRVRDGGYDAGSPGSVASAHSSDLKTVK